MRLRKGLTCAKREVSEFSMAYIQLYISSCYFWGDEGPMKNIDNALILKKVTIKLKESSSVYISKLQSAYEGIKFMRLVYQLDTFHARYDFLL